MPFVYLFCIPLCLFGHFGSDLSIGLRALQQIRTLIPERFSEEEFSILVDRKAFAETVKKEKVEIDHQEISLDFYAGCSHFYLNRWTISGEPVRILDRYQEFEYGPYWLYPTALQRLYDMHGFMTSEKAQ